MFLYGDFFDTSYATGEVARFIADLNGGNGQDQLKDLALYIKYRANPSSFNGRCGESIGSERYIDNLENMVFGGRLSPGELSRGEYSYGDSLEEDLKTLGNFLVDDTGGTPYDNYIIYENRVRLADAAGNLERFTSSCRKSTAERNVGNYRRLEGFNNEVFEFETHGSVRAKMEWLNGTNTMYIEANVYFKSWFLSDIRDDVVKYPNPSYSDKLEKFENRVKKAIDNFEEWAGDYTVFGGQPLKVEVKINRKYSGAGASVVHIFGDGDAAGVALGGAQSGFSAEIDINLLFEGKSPIVSTSYYGPLQAAVSWDKNNSKVMGLSGDFTAGNIPTHEFGHWLGLQDAYRTDNNSIGNIIPYPLHGVMMTINALAAADRVIVPVQPEYLSVIGMTQLFDTVALVKKQVNPGLQIEGVLIILANMRTNLAKNTVKIIGEAYGGSVRIFPHPIPYSTKVKEASASGKSIFAYEPKGNQDYRSGSAKTLKSIQITLAARLEKLVVMLMVTLKVPALAADDPLEVVNNLSDFIFGLIRAVGIIQLGWGIVQVGPSLQSHDPSQRSNGFLTLAGGIVITFAKEILTLITGG